MAGTARINPFDRSTFAKPAPRRRATPGGVRPGASRREKAERDLNIAFTPETFEHRVDRIGRDYIWSRGDVVERSKGKTRTVMIQMSAYPLFQELLQLGVSLKVSARREYLPDENGDLVVEIYRAREVLKVFDAEGREICGETGRVLVGHDRIGYYRRQRHGTGNMLSKILWIPETKVNGGRLADDDLVEMFKD